MRKLNISPPRLVFVAGVALLCACHKSENEQIFDKLDRVIAKKHLYEERFVRHADSLRRVLRAAGDDTLRWQTANRLFDSYITYNIDTAARYAGLMHNYADATGSREMKFLSTTCAIPAFSYAYALLQRPWSRPHQYRMPLSDETLDSVDTNYSS